MWSPCEEDPSKNMHWTLIEMMATVELTYKQRCFTLFMITDEWCLYAYSWLLFVCWRFSFLFIFACVYSCLLMFVYACLSACVAAFMFILVDDTSSNLLMLMFLYIDPRSFMLIRVRSWFLAFVYSCSYSYFFSFLLVYSCSSSVVDPLLARPRLTHVTFNVGTH